MKKFLLLLAFLSFAHSASAQQDTGSITSQASSCTFASGQTTTACVQMNVNTSTNTILFTIDGTPSATLQFEYTTSDPNGTIVWRALQVVNLTSLLGVTSTTVTGSFAVNNPNYNAVRVRASAYSSGPINIRIRGTNNSSVVGVIFGGGSATIGGVTVADGADTALGTTTDAKNAATDTTSVTAIALFKEISDRAQAAAASLSSTLTVTGTGNFSTIGSKTDNGTFSTDNLNSLTCLFNAALSTTTEGKSGFTSCDLQRLLRVRVVKSDLAGSTPVLANALSTTVKAISSSPQILDSYFCWNPNSSVAYVQFFNVASGSVTLGTTTPIWSIGIPPTQSGNLSSINLAFSTALSAAATTTATGLTANSTALDCNFGYR